MHTIQRAGTYACSIQTPEAPETYSLIRVTFAQNQQIIVEKQTGEGDAGLHALHALAHGRAEGRHGLLAVPLL